jgi:nitrous oxidase accessory protein NosD
MRISNTDRISPFRRRTFAFPDHPGAVQHFRLSTITRGFLLTCQGGADHGRSTAHAAFDCDGAGYTIQLAGPAFHASLGVRQYGKAAIHFKNGMRADCHAHGASVAKSRIIDKSINFISV